MPWSGYTESERKIAEAAEGFFKRIYENPNVVKGTQIISQLSWKPSLYFKGLNHEIIAVEASETPYPAILKAIHSDLIHVQIPLVVYCICPEDTFLEKSAQEDIKKLVSNGFGVLTVDDNGQVLKRHSCIPLVQHIHENVFEKEIKDLIPRKIKIRVRDAFETYKNNAAHGLTNLTEITESIVIDSGKKLSGKGWIDKKLVKRGKINDLLDKVYNEPRCANVKPAVAGLINYISTYRNTAHHTPRNKKQAHRKYEECRHGFLEGIKQIKNFREAFKSGLNINISC